MDGQGSTRPRRPPRDSLPVWTRVQRPGPATKAQRRYRALEKRGQSGTPGGRGIGGCAGRAHRGERSPAGRSALAGKAAEPLAFKEALTFLGFPLANGRPPGRKRGGGGQSGFLSPPPAAWRTTFQLEGEGGRQGSGRGALELLRKLGARPRGLGAHGLSTLALAPRGPVRCVRIPSRRGSGHPPKTLRGAFRQTRSLECLRDG